MDLCRAFTWFLSLGIISYHLITHSHCALLSLFLWLRLFLHCWCIPLLWLLQSICTHFGSGSRAVLYHEGLWFVWTRGHGPLVDDDTSPHMDVPIVRNIIVVTGDGVQLTTTEFCNDKRWNRFFLVISQPQQQEKKKRLKSNLVSFAFDQTTISHTDWEFALSS